jgi:hypothetical protein
VTFVIAILVNRVRHLSRNSLTVSTDIFTFFSRSRRSRFRCRRSWMNRSGFPDGRADTTDFISVVNTYFHLFLPAVRRSGGDEHAAPVGVPRREAHHREILFRVNSFFDFFYNNASLFIPAPFLLGFSWGNRPSLLYLQPDPRQAPVSAGLQHGQSVAEWNLIPIRSPPCPPLPFPPLPTPLSKTP